MGNVGASNSTWGFHFRGQALVQAMMTALTTTHHLDTATKIYFVGCSAGARGVMTNVDILVENSIFPSNAAVIAILDSPYYLDVQPYNADFEGFQYQEQQKYELFNTTGIIPADCAAEFATSEQWKCQYGQYRMEFVRTPYFLIASQYDSYQLSLNTQLDPDQYNAEAAQYAEQFAALDKQSLEKLSEHALSAEAASNKRGDGFAFYSWACYNHAVAESPLFYTATTNDGITLKDALEQFLVIHPATNTGHRRVLQWIDDCSTFDCGTGCDL